jgi:hypothetical protein
MTASDPQTARDRLAEMAVQIRGIARALTRPDAPSFMVLLLTYKVDGEEYATTGLTVSATATPNLTVTKDGFECDAFFPAGMLTSGALAPKESKDHPVRVRVAVRLRDIIDITPLTGVG